MRTRVTVWWLSIALAFAASMGVAAAHPLGNFTINHLAKVSLANGTLKVRYVLDIAEIPTFQIMHAGSASDTWTSVQLHSWGESEVQAVREGFHLTVDGVAVQLQRVSHRERLRPGAGGLPTLYWAADFKAPLSAGKHRIAIDDAVYADRRIGWKDVIIAPQTEPTHELLSYPAALIGSPRHVNAVTFDIAADGRVQSLAARSEDRPDLNASNSIVRSNALSDMFSNGNRTPFFVFTTILVAFGLGALHAIEPGHGKALLAFTLVGSRATVKQAAILAASLTFAHTIGVLILGFVLFFAASFVSESIYPWITLLSGVAVAVIGARNLARYLRGKRIHTHPAGAVHAHGFRGDHHHGDGEAANSHAIPGTGPIDFHGAVVAAMSGGIAPCPAAIVVMLAALRLHQLGYGLFLIVIFSLGLASVLTVLGIAVVHGSAWVTRSGKFDRLVSAGPLISAALISIVGAIMIGQGFVAQGIHAPLWIPAGLVVLAIGGYGFAPQHSHAHATEHQPV